MFFTTVSTLKLLIAAIKLGSLDAAITAAEREGRDFILDNPVLPVSWHSNNRDNLEHAGLIFSGLTRHHPAFINVTMPHGWRKLAEGNNIVHVLDEQGRLRAVATYIVGLACVYAYAYTVPRFSLHYDHDLACQGVMEYCAMDGGRIIFKSALYGFALESADECNTAQAKACKEVVDWLDTHHKGWQGPSPYGS